MKMLQQGFILPIILISMFMITTTSLYILDLSVANHTTATKEAARVNAQFAADSGLDIGIQDLNADETITNLPETTLYSDTKQRTTYQILIVDGAVSTKKSIIATGRTYIPASAATATVVRKYQLDVAAVTSGIGLTSVVSGVGGLILNNNARITGGDVAINGSLTINNNAQIGLSTTDYINHPEQIVNVRVADMICPIPATAAFPRVCAGGEAPEPITMGLNGFIYGDVRATNQVTGTNMLNPGLTLSQTVAPYVLPDYDRAGQKAAVTSTVNATDAGIKCANNASVTWPANVKIVGDVATGNNCSVTITGDVWITGSVSMGNKAQFVISNALGTTRPTIMIDGPLGVVFGTTNTIVQNTSGTGSYVLTYYCGASCSPDSTVTGTALAASQTILTLDLSNNSSAPGSILYAKWSKVRISNNGSIGAVAGQTVELGANAVINFTASVPGSNNLTKTWVKRGYMRSFN